MTQLRFILLGLALFAASLVAQAKETTIPFESEIAAFAAKDKAAPPPPGGILFAGSSSIRLWKTLEADFPGYPVINRGFGGSQIADSTAVAERIILPCQPRVVLLYAGDNDLAAGKSPQQVAEDFKAFVAKISAALPRVQIAFIAIKPSPSRWKLAEKVREANALIKDFTERNPRLRFIDVYTPMIGANGEPRKSLFIADQLHMNPSGYALWTSLIRPHLEALSEGGEGRPFSEDK